MISAWMDRLFTAVAVAALTAWAACQAALWARVFDASGASAVITLSAAMFSLAAAGCVWARLAPGALGTLARGLVPGHARARGAAALFAVGCGSVSVGATFAAPALARFSVAHFLWSPIAWAALKFAVQLLGMFPLALGACAVFSAVAAFRTRTVAGARRVVWWDFAWGLVAGLAVLVGAWWGGVDLVGVSLLSAGALLALGVADYVGSQPARRPRPPGRARKAVPIALAAVVLASLAVVALAGCLQARAVTDILGLSETAAAGWIVLSAALLAAFLAVVDRKSRPPGRAAGVAAAAGIVAGMMLQAMLAATCLATGVRGWLCAAMAGAIQVPLAALAATAIARHRRMLASHDARPATYLALASAGAGLGVGTYLLIGLFPAGRVVLLIAGVCILALATIGGIGAARRRRGQLMWSATGAVLMGSVALGVLAADRAARRGVGPVTPGVWLTGLESRAVAGAEAGPVRSGACLPLVPTWRSGDVDGVQTDILARHRGRWWAVASAPGDLPQALPAEVYLVGSAPDPTAVPPGAWHDTLDAGGQGDFFRALQLPGERFDGVLLAPLPAGHSQAWRCYNLRTLRRVAERSGDGPILLRTQAGGEQLLAAMAVAATFHQAVGSGWLIADFRDDQVDVLVVGPAHTVTPPPARSGLYVVRLEKLFPDVIPVRPILVTRPGAGNGIRMDAWRLEARLRWAMDSGGPVRGAAAAPRRSVR